jgi:hypothetical protein
MILVPVALIGLLVGVVAYANIIYWREWAKMDDEGRRRWKEEERDDMFTW